MCSVDRALALVLMLWGKAPAYPFNHHRLINFDIFTTAQQGGTARAGSDVVQSGRLIFDDFFQHLWPYIGNNTANVVFQMGKRLWLIRVDQ
ncbi:hypothetical protein TNCV_2402421 [Trichonephila clavipes]|nr:hypothetical protein TNCV_2402421 [Trichonephila clavipes]